jgi:AGZA family xanthine/uracil permease-like MFS transporter
VAAGIGLFIAFIGFKDAGIIVSNPATSVGLGRLTAPSALIAILGLVIIAALQARRVKGSMLIGIVLTTLIGWSAGLGRLGASPFKLGDLAGTAFKLNIFGALHMKGDVGLTLIEIVFVFLFVDLFDNVGTLVAVTTKAGLVAPDGSIPRLKRILFADSLATMAGAVLGTSTVTSYVESAAGVAEGGRTGLTSVVVGLLFFATLLFAPLVQAIPIAATAPVLIMVGALMIGAVTEIEWTDPIVAVPAFLTLIAIPLTYSIANGLAFGIISYAALSLLNGQARLKDWLLYLLAALFMARFVYLANG